MGWIVSRDNVSRDDKQTRSQLELHVDVFKHLFDLFFKGLVIYLAVVGATAGYIYSDKATAQSQAALSVFVSIISVLTIVGCGITLRWIREIQGNVDAMSDDLSVKRVPLAGAKGIVSMVMIGASVSSKI